MHTQLFQFKACVITLLLAGLLGASPLAGQCFVSPGNPIAGSANVGVLQKGTWRAMMHYKYDKREDYFEGSRRMGPGVVKSAHFNFMSATLAYGITSKLSLEAEAGYFLNKTQQYQTTGSTTGYGLANALVSAKYLLLHQPAKNLELTTALGVNLPFSHEPQVVDGVELPMDLQPSVGHYGLVWQSLLLKELPEQSLRFFWVNRAELGLNENQQGYRFGNTYHSTVFVARHLHFYFTDLTKDFTAIVQLRYQYDERNTRQGEKVQFSGGQKFFVAPQLNYNLGGLWNISLIAEFPVYQYFNGIQMGHKHSFALVLSRDMGHEWFE